MTTLTKLSNPFSCTSTDPSSSFAYLPTTQYQVKALSSVASGALHVQGASPTGGTLGNWVGADPVVANPKCDIVSFWGGGAADIANALVYCHGGGHAASYNNGVYAYDFKGNAAPAGMSLLTGSLSNLSAVTAPTNGSTYNDGKPAANHTYDGLIITPQGAFYRVGGVSSSGPFSGPGGDWKQTLWKFSGGAWSQKANVPGTLGQGDACFCAFNGVDKFFVTDWNHGTYAIYSTASDTWLTGDANLPNSSLRVQYPVYPTNIYVPTDANSGRIFSLGGANPGGTNPIFNINWATNQCTSISTRSTRAPNEDVAGPGAIYDASRGVIWIVNPQFMQLSALNVTTLAIQTFTLTGATMSYDSNGGNGYMTNKRVVLLNNNSALGLVTAYNANAYAIKL